MAKSTQEPQTGVFWLKPEQVAAMRDAAHEGHHGQRDDAIITLLYDTGLRRAELAQVDREMVGVDDGILRLPGTIQKDYPTDESPGPVSIELDPEGDLRTVRTLQAYLSLQGDDCEALFPSRKSDRMTGKGINDVVKRCAERANVKPYTTGGRGWASDVTALSLRHSVSYRMLCVYSGYTLYDVRDRLRHAWLSTTEGTYDHFDAV